MPRAFSSGALSIWSYAFASPPNFLACTTVSAAVSVVLPWSTCPMVPTFTCGLVRSNFALDTVLLRLCLLTSHSAHTYICMWRDPGAHDRNRTGDLVLTKDVLCRLSYMGDKPSVCLYTISALSQHLERVMGIEPTP